MIYVECQSDEMVVRSVTRDSPQQIVHERGKGAVCRRLAKVSHCTGVIDEDADSSRPPYLERASTRRELQGQALTVFRYIRQRNVIVILRPRLEEWLLGAASQANIDISARPHNLPGRPAEFKRALMGDPSKLDQLLQDLLKQRSSRLLALRRLLTQRRG